jgi:hypothetical protein
MVSIPSSQVYASSYSPAQVYEFDPVPSLAVATFLAAMPGFIYDTTISGSVLFAYSASSFWYAESVASTGD